MAKDNKKDGYDRVTRRMRKIVEEQGHAIVLIVFAVVLVFVCLPVFLVDDMLYVHTTRPEVTKRGETAAVAPGTAQHQHQAPPPKRLGGEPAFRHNPRLSHQPQLHNASVVAAKTFVPAASMPASPTHLDGGGPADDARLGDVSSLEEESRASSSALVADVSSDPRDNDEGGPLPPGQQEPEQRGGFHALREERPVPTAVNATAPGTTTIIKAPLALTQTADDAAEQRRSGQSKKNESAAAASADDLAVDRVADGVADYRQRAERHRVLERRRLAPGRPRRPEGRRRPNHIEAPRDDRP